MTQAESGVRRVWVGFSALGFAICGVLLLIQFSERLARPPAAASSPSAPSSQMMPDPKPLPPPPQQPLPPPPPQPLPPKKDPPPRQQLGGSTANRTESTLNNMAGDSPDDDAPAKPQSKGYGGKGAGAKGGAMEGEGKSGRKNSQLSKTRGLANRTIPVDPEDETVPQAQPSTPVPSSPPPRVEDKLTEGILKVNVPPTMLVGQSEHVRAVIGAKRHIDLVDKEAALETNDGARVQIGRDLLISALVRMELRGDSAGEFDITALAPEATQRINDNDATVWEWSVTPKLDGKRSLTLVVSDLKDPSRETIRSKIYPVHIDVNVTTWQRARDITVAGSSVLSGLAGLIGAWLGLLRPLLQRRQGEGGATTPRPPLVVTPAPAQPTPPAAVAPVVAATPPPSAPAAEPANAARPVAASAPATDKPV